jgi:hypothetical protein
MGADNRQEEFKGLDLPKPTNQNLVRCLETLLNDARSALDRRTTVPEDQPHFPEYYEIKILEALLALPEGEQLNSEALIAQLGKERAVELTRFRDKWRGIARYFESPNPTFDDTHPSRRPTQN